MSDISAAVLSYLETFSREELIELIHSFVLTHEDIRLALEEKSGAGNVKIKDDAASAHSPRLPQKAFTANVDTLPLPHAPVNRNSTPQEKSICIHLSLSAGRMSLPCDGTMQSQTKAVIRRCAKTNGKRENAI